MRILSVLAAALLALTFATNGAMAAGEGKARYGKQKVVYHINYPGGKEDKKWKGALRNIQNHINAVGSDKLDIKVVLHGNGVAMLKSANKDGSTLQENVTRLKGQNIAFQVCANTLRGKKFDYNKDLYDVYKEDIVPSGVAELARLQQKGYTYIKP